MNATIQTFALITSAFATSTTNAAPPNLECLADLSSDEIIFYSNLQEIRPIIILLGEQNTTDPDEHWALWRDPEVLKLIKDRKLLVTYMDEDTIEQRDIKFFKPESRPLIIYRDRKGEEHRRPLELFPKTAEELIDWLKFPNREANERKTKEWSLLHRIARNPNSIQPRLELIELYKAHSESDLEHHRFVPWLLLNIDLWYAHEKHTLSEDKFRLKVFQMIRGAREDLDLFGRVSTRVNKGTVFDTWIERLNADQWGAFTGFIGPKLSTRWQWANTLKPHYIDVELETLTDREQFILKALTAEGEEWQRLVDEFRPIKPSQNLTDPPKSDP